MKIRSSFVSNSSSSSFVVLKDSISKEQQDCIIDYISCIDYIISNDSNLEYSFSYYKTDPWNIRVFDDFILCETSMDNFDMGSYLDYLKIDDNLICWNDGYNNEPYPNQLEFLNNLRIKIRKDKLDKLNDIY